MLIAQRLAATLSTVLLLQSFAALAADPEFLVTVEKRAVNLGPVLGGQELAGQGHCIFFFCDDVAFLLGRERAQGSKKFRFPRWVVNDLARQRTQGAQIAGPVPVVLLQRIEYRCSLVAARSKDSKQEIVFLRVM